MWKFLMGIKKLRREINKSCLPAFLLAAASPFLTQCGCAGTGSCAGSDTYQRSAFEIDESYPENYPRTIYRTRSGSNPVLFLHELPGLTPGALQMAQRLSNSNLESQVYLPLLFGKLGQNNDVQGLLATGISPRFQNFCPTSCGSIRQSAFKILDHIATRHPGKSITVIGNCLTGSIALESLQHPRVNIAVVCQPAVPFTKPGLFARYPRTSWALPESSLAATAALLENNPNKHLISINYLNDEVAPFEKTAAFAKRYQGKQPQHSLILASEKSGTKLTDPRARSILRSLSPAQVQILTVSNDNAHSTITGADCPDRETFRTTLINKLNTIAQ